MFSCILLTKNSILLADAFFAHFKIIAWINIKLYRFDILHLGAERGYRTCMEAINTSGPTLLLDSYLSVWWRAGVRQGRGRGPRGSAESSAGASLTHVGQSSVEIGLMNRRERETAGLLVFQYPPSLSVGPVFICTTWGEKKMRRSVGGKSGPVKRISDNRS